MPPGVAGSAADTGVSGDLIPIVHAGEPVVQRIRHFLQGRTVAGVNDALIRSSGLFAGSAATRPLVRNLVPDLTPGEENWLLALVALELYHSADRYRNRPRASHF